VLLAFLLPAVLRIATEASVSYDYFPQYDAHSSPLVAVAKYYASERESWSSGAGAPTCT